MVINPLNAQERARLLNAIHEALMPTGSEFVLPQANQDRRGLASIERHLDVLVEIVRQSTAQKIEPYLAQILEEICSKCPQSQPSLFCELRSEGKCVLFRQASLILKAIATVLEEIHDPEYMAQHST